MNLSRVAMDHTQIQYEQTFKETGDYTLRRVCTMWYMASRALQRVSGRVPGGSDESDDVKVAYHIWAFWTLFMN